MKNIDPFKKISEKTINECIDFLQKSNDVKDVLLTQFENAKPIVRCSTYSDSVLAIVISDEFENFEQILDFFQKIIQYNISIIAITIYFNENFEDFNDKDNLQEILLSRPEFKEPR